MEKIPEENINSREDRKEGHSDIFEGFSPKDIIPSMIMDGIKIDEYGRYMGNIIENSGSSFHTKFSDARLSEFQYLENNSVLAQEIADLEKKSDYSDEEIQFYEDLKKDWEFIKELKERFLGKVVVDLGCADPTEAYILACSLGATGYIGVDSDWDMVDKLDYIANKQKEKLNSGNYFENGDDSKDVKDWEPIPYSVVREDMLSFLKRLPEDEVNIFCFGIDAMVMMDTPKEYLSQTREEIARVINKNGAQLTDDNLLLVGEDLKDMVDPEFYQKKFLSLRAFIKNKD